MTGGPVEAFLAELGRRLRRDESTRRRVVAEVGDHLRDLVAEGRGHGLDEHEAELEAVEPVDADLAHDVSMATAWHQ